ncbi:MAG: SDR family NAD(P)-dependent oxidoreductase [Trebonia sp.]
MSDPVVPDVASGTVRALAGHRVVVTGAAGGIGFECAARLGALGAAVLLADIDADAVRAAAQRLATGGVAASAMAADVTDQDQCRALTSMAMDRLGGVDGAVLAAGVAEHVPFLEMSRAEWERMLAIHLTGTFFCLQAVAQALIGGGGGAIVYVGSSVAAGLGPLCQAHYVAAKAGALGLVRAAARELGRHGIRVNAVSPGFTDTAMNAGLFSVDEVRRRATDAPLGRVARPTDVAGAVAFLLGADSGFMTGQTLHVNGGTYMP